jgi:hypothetical protein
MWRRPSADRAARRRSARAELRSRSKKRLWSRRCSLCSSRWFSRCQGSVRIRWLVKARRLRRRRLLRRLRLHRRVLPLRPQLRPRPLRALSLHQVPRLRPRSSYRLFSSSDGGTGRRARLRGVWGNPCEFDSRSEHLYPQVRPSVINHLRSGRFPFCPYFVHPPFACPFALKRPPLAPPSQGVCESNAQSTLWLYAP